MTTKPVPTPPREHRGANQYTRELQYRTEGEPWRVIGFCLDTEAALTWARALKATDSAGRTFRVVAPEPEGIVNV